MALKKLLDLEHEVRLTAFEYGAGDFDLPPLVHPRQMLGIEVEPFAHELASITLWIGYFQWKRAHGGDWPTPVLERLTNIQHHDALLNEDGSEFAWPAAEYIVGNPPFVGNTRMRQRLGSPYVVELRAAYDGRVPAKADLVTYWFEKARALIAQGWTRRAGLIATNSIRGGASAKVLEHINQSGQIFMSWPDVPWVQEGAAVRVSIVGFDNGSEQTRTLSALEGPEEDQPVTRIVQKIHADLTSGLDLRTAQPLRANQGRSFEGIKPAGKFDVPAKVARGWLDLPNPTGVSNRDVLKPYISGEDLTEAKGKDRWLIDFNQMTLEEAEQYRRPMQHVLENVKPKRDLSDDLRSRKLWWLHQRSRPEFRTATNGLSRFIVTTIHATYRFFVWLTPESIPNNALTIIAAEDDYTFGILNSGIHILWASRLGSSLEDRPRYTASTTFATFPFPEKNEQQGEAVGVAARYLEQARDFLKRQTDPESRSGGMLGMTRIYHLLAHYRQAQQELVNGITTLADAHATLDQAVAAAYGWEWPLSEDEVLSRLLALNLERSSQTSVSS